jgi:putative peptidoglycan lipid II flippase
MSTTLHKKSILKKTTQVASSTLISRILALVRTGLELQYLGAGPLSDAFKAAYRIPNTLRKVFAEGAISAAFIPNLIKIVKDGEEEQANKLMTLMLFFIESIVLILCFLIFLNAESFLLFVAPGFKYKTVEMATAIPLLRILIFFIFFISSSSLLAGAMQAKHNFFVPSWGPVLLNIFYIAGLLFGIAYNLPIVFLAWFIIVGGLLLLIMHIYTYFKLGYKFALPDRETIKHFKLIMIKFLPCIITMSGMELNFMIDGMLASFLPAGSLSLFDYASGFFRIPLGVFAVAFSTILLSHFSRVCTYAPKRLSFYLLESTKFVFWVTIPVSLIMSFFSYKFFYTLALYSGKLTVGQVAEASLALKGLLIGLFFVSLNKILLSIYYALDSTFLPTAISLFGTIINTLLNIALVPTWGIFGLAIGTSIGELVKTIIFVYMLRKKFNFALFYQNFLQFLLRFSLQLVVIGSILYGIYTFLIYCMNLLPFSYTRFFVHGFGFWIWAGLLSFTLFVLLYILRKVFKIKVYFLD